MRWLAWVAGEPADFGFVFFADGFAELGFGEHSGFGELGSERVDLLALVVER